MNQSVEKQNQMKEYVDKWVNDLLDKLVSLQIQ